jgi:hypothetical protein
LKALELVKTLHHTSGGGDDGGIRNQSFMTISLGIQVLINVIRATNWEAAVLGLLIGRIHEVCH